MPDDRIDKAIKDPSFLALSPDDQVAVLQHYKDNPVQPAPASEGDSFWSKLGRGASGGAKQGAGIPEDTDLTTLPGVVKGVAGAAVNTGKGLYEAGKSIITPPQMTDKGLPATTQDWEKTVLGPAGEVVGNMARGLEGAGSEAWKGLKDSDPETFAHGFASAATQLLMLGAAGKGAIKSVTPRARMAGASAAIGAGAEQVADLKRAMPEMVKTAKDAGIQTVGDFGKAVKDAKAVTDETFNEGFAPIKNKHYMPVEISRSIQNLITPDMLKDYNSVEQAKALARAHADAKAATLNKPPAPVAMDPWVPAPPPEPVAAPVAPPKPKPIRVSDSMQNNHDSVVEIQRQAKEYARPWTLEELNARRMTENENLRSFYNKDTRGQSASPVQTAISEAIRNGTADIVYDQWEKANPKAPINARELKARQGALWELDDYTNNPKHGQIAQLEAKQLKHEAQGIGDRVRTGAAVSGGGAHGYISGLSNMFSPGPLSKANKGINRAFGGSYTTPTRLAVMSLPVAHLASNRRTTPFDINPPPAPPSDADQPQ